MANTGEASVGWSTSDPLNVRPPMTTLTGVMSTVIVVDCCSEGSAPTMLNPYVTPSSGLSAVPNQCVSVLVVGRGFAPLMVMVEAWIAESGTVIGAGVVPAPAVDATKGRVSVNPASTASLRA